MLLHAPESGCKKVTGDEYGESDDMLLQWQRHALMQTILRMSRMSGDKNNTELVLLHFARS